LSEQGREMDVGVPCNLLVTEHVFVLVAAGECAMKSEKRQVYTHC
jgi:hypothetical protein